MNDIILNKKENIERCVGLTGTRPPTHITKTLRMK